VPVYFSKKSFLDKIYFAVVLLMIFSPVVHPWYIAWVLVTAVITGKWSGIYFASAASLTSLTVLNYQINGIWKDYLPVQFIEYVPVIIWLAYEFAKSEREKQFDAVS
jgi:predicted neutral ceramidase superfamily lipid hydrolase